VHTIAIVVVADSGNRLVAAWEFWATRESALPGDLMRKNKSMHRTVSTPPPRWREKRKLTLA